VVEALARSPEHRSAEEILVRVNELHPTVGRASVFRTLRLLLRAGVLLSSSRAEKRTTYYLSPSGRHHHLICTECGRTVAFDECVASDLEEALAQRHGWS
jgi:Fur family ferric uptake transcriptional regulator